MQKNKKILIGAGALIAAIAVGGYCAMRYHRFEETKDAWGHFNNNERDGQRQNDNNGHGMMGSNNNNDNRGGMMQNGQMMNNSGGVSERQYLDEMIPHHQEAIDTSTFVAAHGENADVKKLAQDIITSQQKQLADMKSWYKSWYGVDYKDNGSYRPMMRSNLTSLSGNTLDRAFLDDMIQHHMSALMLGQAVVPNIQHQEIADLDKSIAEGQSSEIITMRILEKQI